MIPMIFHSVAPVFGTVASEGEESRQEWQRVIEGFGTEVTKEDRSALVSALATAVNTFMQKQVQ